MPRVIEPDDPEAVKAAMLQNEVPAPPPSPQSESPDKPSLQPVAIPVSPPAGGETSITQPQQPDYDNLNRGKRNRLKIFKLIIIFFVVIILCLAVWHFWVTPNKKSGKTIVGTADNTTLLGLNKDHMKTLPSGIKYPDYTKPIEIPSARQTYSIENGGFKYTFQYLKNSREDKYTDTNLQDVATPARSFSIYLWIKPADNQNQLTCGKEVHYTANHIKYFTDTFKVRDVNVLGQNYPLCGTKTDNSDKLSGEYSLRFFYLGKWHEFFLYGPEGSYFTDQLAAGVLNSLRVEKL